MFRPAPVQSTTHYIYCIYSFSLPLLSPLVLISESPLPLILSASLQPLAVVPLSDLEGAICQAGILLPPDLPAPSNAFAADVVVDAGVPVDEAGPLGGDVPLVFVGGCGIF